MSLVGRTIAGKFRIDAHIGRGAMGAVYRARQLALEKDVAIKVLHDEVAEDETFVARFHREARAASRLDHPSSTRVIDFGQDGDGLLYIAMELLDGRDLLHLIEHEWPLGPERIVDLMSQTLAAVAVAHELGIVHRDLKPENIMVLRGTDDDGQPRDVVKVCDFGVAKFTDRRIDPAQQLSTMGLVLGTPEYMSPEQGKGEEIDARSDLYSMGVILYQLLTRRVPFDGESALGVVLQHVTDEAVAPRVVNPFADEELEAVCVKAMRKKREERYQSAREMRADLRAALAAAQQRAQNATVETVALALETPAAPPARPATSAAERLAAAGLMLVAAAGIWPLLAR